MRLKWGEARTGVDVCEERPGGRCGIVGACARSVLGFVVVLRGNSMPGPTRAVG